MTFSALAYVVFTVLLALVMLGIILYYFNPARKQQVEKPKHTMLEEDE
ncbi:MAG: cbb3-type cytochrome c oxidase subunit 3 [Chlorobiaceae bacterium]|nr:cbb3-type cytochrome c oxidase subunit 3 [Chlorobiaceae bacterium]